MKEMQENIHILEVQKIDPPKQNDPPPTIEKIKVVEDNLKVAETIIKYTKINKLFLKKRHY
jgi:protein TonB